MGCSSQPIYSRSAITDKEKHICDSLKVDSSLIPYLRKYSSEIVEPFHYSFSRQLFENGTEKELDPIYLQGLVFKETTSKTEIILDNLYGKFKDKGYTLFILIRNFGINNKPDVMGILKTIDKYEILRSIKTQGANYDIDQDSLRSIIKIFDTKYSLDLVGAGGDWCEFKINKEPTNWLTFAQEAYKACPDIVNQGMETVEALADEMEKTKRLYFWWD